MMVSTPRERAGDLDGPDGSEPAGAELGGPDPSGSGPGGPDPAARYRWLGLLARAPRDRLEAAAADPAACGGPIPDHSPLRAPEVGLVMVRGRIGGTGAPFNLGEMTATRCSVRLEDGTIGHATVGGRDRRHAELAALFDALLQDPDRAATIERQVLTPLAAAEAAADALRARQVAATRVDFQTLVRGD